MPLSKYQPKQRTKKASISKKKASTTVKKGHTTIEVHEDEPKPRIQHSKRSPTFSVRLVKVYRLILIFFYGQFFATALYTNLIHEIPIIIKHPGSFYPSLKVALGVFMVVHTFFAVVSIWKKSFKLIFGSICSLIILSGITMVTAIIDLVQKNERKQLHETEMSSTAVEIGVEALLRLLAVGLSLLLVKELRSRYDSVSGDDDEEDDDIELGEIKKSNEDVSDDNEIVEAYSKAEKDEED